MGFETTPEFTKISNDVRQMQADINNEFKSLGWADRLTDLDKFSGGGVFSVKEGEQYGTKKVNINGQEVTINAYRGGTNSGTGAVSTKYEFVFPDGKKMSTSSQRALSSSENYNFLNNVIKNTFSPEHQALNLGQNTSGSFDDNVKKLADFRKVDDSFILEPGEAGGQLTPEQEAERQKQGEENQLALQEKTGFEPENKTQPTFGTEITTSTGQKISPDDPNYETFYKQQYGEPSTQQVPGVSQFEGDSFKEELPTGLKNQGIANANPSVPANAGFINALYQEGFRRDATQEELNQFVGKTVKDASNIILGAERSPFSGVQTGGTADDAGVDETTDDTTADVSDLAGDPDFDNLPPDLQAIAELMLNAVNARDEETRGLAQEALEQAQAIVDPFTAVTLASALASIPEQFKVKKDSIENQLATAQDNMNKIANLMEDATFEEQQQLGSLARSFERNIENIENQATEAGLTFSSKRAEEERFIGEQNLDVIRSTQRGTRRRLEELDVEKAAQERQEKLTREAGEATLKQIARGTEELVGTEEAQKLGLTGLSGEKLGTTGGKEGLANLPGSIEENRRQQILSLAQTFGQFQEPSQVSQLFN